MSAVFTVLLRTAEKRERDPIVEGTSMDRRVQKLKVVGAPMTSSHRSMDDLPWVELATEIRVERVRQGVRQKDLARRIGIPQPMLSRIENGQEPPYGVARRIFKELGMLDVSFTFVQDMLE